MDAGARMNKSDMIAFEDAVATDFNAGRIPYPVHLTSGNEDALLDIFEDVAPEDWVFGSWRMHYHALLKGVPPGHLRAAIFRGESMALNFPGRRVYGSAIVGGTVPIALGVAMAIKRAGRPERVFCFIGDMTSHTGIAHECIKYSANHDLPITWVVESNGLSVCTKTEEVWGPSRTRRDHVRYYEYQSKWPHAGAGKRIQF